MRNHKLRYILCFIVGFTSGTVVTTELVHRQVKLITVPAKAAELPTSGAVMLLNCPVSSHGIQEWQRVCRARRRGAEVHP